MKQFSLLCLGDSYTIGEGVPLHDSFPYQTLQLLRQSSHFFYAPEIIAKTGWTSFELLEHIEQIKFGEVYDFATLLIGVNNQYRGLATSAFETDFERLLKLAINKVGGRAKNVIVLSIPDWGMTPFAHDRDASKIANEINAFNGVCELMAQKYQTQFVNITNSSRLAKDDVTLLTTDQLHYSAKEMSKWANEVFRIISKQQQTND